MQSFAPVQPHSTAEIEVRQPELRQWQAGRLGSKASGGPVNSNALSCTLSVVMQNGSTRHDSLDCMDGIDRVEF